MERIRTLFAVIVSTVLTLGFVGCAYLTLQGKGPSYYEGIVSPATTMLFLVLTLALVVLAVLPDQNLDQRATETTNGEESAPSQPSQTSYVKAVVEVVSEEE